VRHKGVGNMGHSSLPPFDYPVHHPQQPESAGGRGKEKRPNGGDRIVFVGVAQLAKGRSIGSTRPVRKGVGRIAASKTADDVCKGSSTSENTVRISITS